MRLMGQTLIELNHVISHGMVTYPGLPGPEISEHLSRDASREHYAPGTEFQIGRLTMVANTGTYVDSPWHRYEAGADLSAMPLSSLADLEGVVVHVPSVTEVDSRVLEPYEVSGKAVLVHTGWDRHWGTSEYGAGGHPHLTEDGAAWLVARGAALVGIDSLNVDSISGGDRPAHSQLLAAGIPVVEHLTGLGVLPATGLRFFAVPPRIVGLGSFPVRAFAIVA
jgi:kynurenine formamidase